MSVRLEDLSLAGPDPGLARRMAVARYVIVDRALRREIRWVALLDALGYGPGDVPDDEARERIAGALGELGYVRAGTGRGSARRAVWRLA